MLRYAIIHQENLQASFQTHIFAEQYSIDIYTMSLLPLEINTANKRHDFTLIEELVSSLKQALNNIVTYSNTGGGADSILLVSITNRCDVWSWRYWEISQRESLLATSDDDATPVTGKMAQAAKKIEGKKFIGFSFINDYSLWLCFEDDIDLIIFSEFETDESLIDLCNWEFVDFKKMVSFKVTSQQELVVKRDIE